VRLDTWAEPANETDLTLPSALSLDKSVGLEERELAEFAVATASEGED
jgi:hypothetical protein